MFYRVMKIIFWLAFFSAFVFAAFFWWIKNNFLVIAFLLGALILFVLFLIQKSKFVKKYYRSTFGETLLGMGGIIFLMTSFGTLYFYKSVLIVGYDTAVHFASTTIFVIAVAMFYELLKIKKGVPGVVKTVLISCLVVFVFSFLWEAFQRQGDIWWGTKMFFDPDQPILFDTTTDLVADFYGVFVGGVLLFKNWLSWNKKWLKGNN